MNTESVRRSRDIGRSRKRSLSRMRFLVLVVLLSVAAAGKTLPISKKTFTHASHSPSPWPVAIGACFFPAQHTALVAIISTATVCPLPGSLKSLRIPFFQPASLQSQLVSLFQEPCCPVLPYQPSKNSSVGGNETLHQETPVRPPQESNLRISIHPLWNIIL